MQFLFPYRRDFAIDSICEQIVRALAKRNFTVPGLKISLHDYGTGEQKLRMVDVIRGEDFKLNFGRKQQTLPGGKWNDCAAIHEVTIPGKQIQVWEDSSPTSVYLYVGKNWKKDRDAFMDFGKVNSKLRGERKTYLHYRGGQHDNDLGREYDPQGREPSSLNVHEVMEEVNVYLKDVVLPMIENSPEVTTVFDICAKPAPIPMPENFGPLFCWGEPSDYYRLKSASENIEDLIPAERYGMLGSGWRLVSYDVPCNNRFDKKAYDGFLWCGIGNITPGMPEDDINVPGYHRGISDTYVFRIKPNRANGIFVADQAAYDKVREQVCASVPAGRDRLTDAEVADFVSARAATLVPITEYKGNYALPIVLINRELGFGEVEVISGPYKRY